MDKNITIDDMN